jgi:hypothetical protein
MSLKCPIVKKLINKTNNFGLGPLARYDSEFYFWNLWIYSWKFGRTPWTRDRLIARPLHIQDSTTQKNADASTPRAGFKPMFPVFKLSKTVCTLDRAAIGTGLIKLMYKYISIPCQPPRKLLMLLAFLHMLAMEKMHSRDCKKYISSKRNSFWLNATSYSLQYLYTLTRRNECIMGITSIHLHTSYLRKYQRDFCEV